MKRSDQQKNGFEVQVEHLRALVVIFDCIYPGQSRVTIIMVKYNVFFYMFD